MLSNNPIVSIVIPTYNHAQFLEKCLQSVVNQTFKEWEAIIVNNFSDDNTIDVVNSFKDFRIRLVNFRNKGIIAASRNEGIRASNADIIAFLDSDDIWYADKLEKSINALTEDRDLICHNLRYIKNGKFWKDVKTGPLEKSYFSSLLYNGNCFVTSAVVVRKKSLLSAGCFCEEAKIVSAEDYDLWLKIAEKKIQVHFIDEILADYTIHENSTSKAVLFHLGASLKVVEKHFMVIESSNNLWRNICQRRRKALLYSDAARSYDIQGQKRMSLGMYLKSILMFPFVIKTYVRIILMLSRD
jgi:glycosyltransferase involved in cell wall biosynthesis